jgi:predicted PurR-regulated permease PerM
VEWGDSWWPDIRQDSYWFGAILLIVGLGFLLVPCSSFFRGIAGNIFAAGVVFILFASFKTRTEWVKKVPIRRLCGLPNG